MGQNITRKIKFSKFLLYQFLGLKSRGVPEEGGDGITQSPGERPWTALPTECTSPTPSYPPTAGTSGLTGYTPKIPQNL